MRKPVPCSAQQRDWLAKNYGKKTLTQLALKIGCCVDTVKRILVREGIAEFDGAKFVLSRRAANTTWNRPCMCCGRKDPRPRNLYMCDPCRERAQGVLVI